MEILHWTGIDALPTSIPCKLSYILYKNCAVIFSFQNLTSVIVFHVRPQPRPQAPGIFPNEPLIFLGKSPRDEVG